MIKLTHGQVRKLERELLVFIENPLDPPTNPIGHQRFSIYNDDGAEGYVDDVYSDGSCFTEEELTRKIEALYKEDEEPIIPKHERYFGGKVQCLIWTSNGRMFALDLFEPGEYPFGVAEGREEVQVVKGMIAAKSQKFGPDQPSGSTIVFEDGEDILIACEVEAVCIVRFSPKEG